MEEEGLTTLEGTVQTVVFQNPENGYTVLRLKTENGPVTVVGCLPGIAAGEGLRALGSFTEHQAYGEQFKAEQAERSLPRGAEAILDYLSSGAIRGIGAKTAQLIVARFGDKTLEVMDSAPEKLAELRGITPKRAEEIGKQYKKQAGLRDLMEFLAAYGVRPFAAARLVRAYGDAAKAAVTRNPYILADEYFGLDFFEADDFALKLGFDGNCSERIEAAVLFELRHNTGNGHVFLPREKLAAAAAQLIGAEPSQADAAISDLTDGNYIVTCQVAGEAACYLDDLYRAETGTAEKLLAMTAIPRVPPHNLKSLLEKAESRCGVSFAPEQRAAVEAAAGCGVLVLTGGPGTGKTTTVRGILELFDGMGIATLLAAPTGRAAKRLSEVTGRDAQTVHRLLGAGMPDGENGSGCVFEKCAAEPLDCGALVLDECSMMDVSLTAALLDALPPAARLVMVGDADQLPSVGPGNVFSDVIRSGAVPVVRLTEIFRQARESEIVKNAHLINSGELPALRKNTGDFFFLQRATAEAAADTITGLVASRLPEKMGIGPRDIQVLSPSRKRAAGTAELNLRLQAALNPPADGKKEKAAGERVFRVGDRVMQTRNNYDIMWYKAPAGAAPSGRTETGAGVYNGDVGYIEDIDEDGGTVLVSFEDKLTPYPFEMLSDLELAYAVTVHKAQGSEYPAVVLAAPPGMPRLCTRSVLYTAVTRARNLLIIVGDAGIVASMVENDRRQKRYSGLRARLAGEA